MYMYMYLPQRSNASYCTTDYAVSDTYTVHVHVHDLYFIHVCVHAKPFRTGTGTSHQAAQWLF